MSEFRWWDVGIDEITRLTPSVQETTASSGAYGVSGPGDLAADAQHPKTSSSIISIRTRQWLACLPNMALTTS